MAKGTDIGKAYVQIVPSAEGIKGSITDVLSGEAGSAGKNAGDSFGKKMISAIGALGIGAAIYKVVSSSVSEGAELEQSIGGIETLFKESSDKMQQYAAEAYKTAGLSANDYMQQATSFAAALVGSLGGDTEKAADSANQALIDMADNSNKMGTSIESIQNAYQGFAKQNYTMLDNLKLGYGGTKTEMQRLLADATKISGVKYDMSNLSDVYEAIHVIQSELGITGTTAKEASSTITGSSAAMKAAFSNLLGDLALGKDIEPALTSLIDTTSTFLFNNLLPMIGNIIKMLPSTVLQIIQEYLPNLMQQVIPLIGEFLLTLPGELLTTLEQLIPAFIDMGMELIDSGLIEGIIDTIPSLMEQGLSIIMTLGNAIIDNLPHLIDRAFEIVTTLAVTIVSELPNLLRRILEGIKEIDWKQLGKAIVNGIIDGVKSLLSALKDTVVNAAKSAWQAVKDFLGIHSPSKKFMFIGENMALGLGKGYADAMPYVLEQIGKQSGLLNDDILSDVNTTIKPISTKRINNLEINFAINNEGKDITEEDIDKWSLRMVARVNEQLGQMI